jgi:hypothetical protein
VHLIRRYLAGFGPAGRDDIASWAGLKRAHVDPVLDRLEPRRFRDEAGGELLDVPRAPLPDPETPAPVRFLPTWDAVLLVHARRHRVLPEQYRPRVFSTKMPQSVGRSSSTGAVAGTWRYEDGRITWQPFARLDAGHAARRGRSRPSSLRRSIAEPTQWRRDRARTRTDHDTTTTRARTRGARFSPGISAS